MLDYIPDAEEVNAVMAYDKIIDPKGNNNMGALRRTTAGNVYVLKKFAGKTFEFKTNPGDFITIGDIDRGVQKLLKDNISAEQLLTSTSTMRRHGTLKLYIENNKGYASFVDFNTGFININTDRQRYEAVYG